MISLYLGKLVKVVLRGNPENLQELVKGCKNSASLRLENGKPETII